MASGSRAFIITFMIVLSTVAPANEVAQRKQFIVHLETGEAWDQALPPAEQPQFKAHSANMQRLRQQGTIVFGARYGEYGLLILESASLSLATQIMEADPGVVAGIFEFRIEPISIFYPWKQAGQLP